MRSEKIIPWPALSGFDREAHLASSPSQLCSFLFLPFFNPAFFSLPVFNVFFESSWHHCTLCANFLLDHQELFCTLLVKFVTCDFCRSRTISVICHLGRLSLEQRCFAGAMAPLSTTSLAALATMYKETNGDDPNFD